MERNNPYEQFTSPDERQEAVCALETEIARQIDEIEKAYSRLGRRFQSLSEQETTSINEMTDKVVALKQKLRKLKEMSAQDAE